MTAVRAEVPERGGSAVPLRYALDEVAAGRPIVLFDEAAGEQYLVFAAQHAAATTVAFAVRHTSGYLCVALPEARADDLELPALPRSRARTEVPDYAVAVDAAIDVTTGISASDRARTIRLLADPDTVPADLVRPGHVVPVRTKADGLLARDGIAEAALDVVRAANCAPAAAFAHVVTTPPGIPLLTVRNVFRLRRATTSELRRSSSARLPLPAGSVVSVRYSSSRTGLQPLAIVAGEPEPGVPVHVHVECLPGDVFGAKSCMCARELDQAMADIARAGRGVVVYVRMAAGDRPHRRTEEHDAVAAEILRDLGVTS